jgi:hypothetical protein
MLQKYAFDGNREFHCTKLRSSWLTVTVFLCGCRAELLQRHFRQADRIPQNSQSWRARYRHDVARSSPAIPVRRARGNSPMRGSTKQNAWPSCCTIGDKRPDVAGTAVIGVIGATIRSLPAAISACSSATNGNAGRIRTLGFTNTSCCIGLPAHFPPTNSGTLTTTTFSANLPP